MRDLPRKLGLLDSVGIVIGVMIGSGIFLVPGVVAQQLPSMSAIVAVWTAAGLLSIVGALAYAELGAMMPATGGQYVYLREAYGPLAGFLCGWAFLLVVQSGSTAALCAGFAIYLGHFLPLGGWQAKLAALALILSLTAINYRGVVAGARVQNLFMFLKLAGLAVLIAAAFLAPAASAAAPAASEPFAWSRFGVAMIACLWTYKGWQTLSFVVGEVRNPERNIPRAMALGVGAVMAIYLIANLAYLRVMPIAEIAATPRVASAVGDRTLGAAGASFVAAAILVSIIGAANGGILATPRIFFAQSGDGLMWRRFTAVHPRFETPHIALVAYGVWTAVLVASGSYQTLFSYVIFTAWIFYGMTIGAVIVLRRRRPAAPRPYRMWGYPATAVLFLAVTAWFVANTILTTPGPSVIGLLVVASGVPAYVYWSRRLPAVGATAAAVR
jgi:APA family basic amino acid/polyamine antiporter